MTGRLTLGYREAVATATRSGRRRAAVRGHEFHRTATDPGAGEPPAWCVNGRRREGFVAGRVHASYLHLHWAGYPPALARRLRGGSGMTARR